VEDLYGSPVTSGAIQAGETLNAAGYTAVGGTVFGVPGLGVEAGDFLRFTTGNGAGQIVRITNVAGNVLTFDPANTLDPAMPTPQIGDEWVVQERARVALGTGGAAPAIDAARQDRQSVNGAIRIAGNVGLANAISNISIAKVGGDRMTLFNETDEAEGESVISNMTVYDSLGTPHIVEVTYVLESKSSLDLQRGNKFRWFAEAVDNYGPDRCVGTGWIQFDTEGRYANENPQAAVQMNLSNSGAITPFIYSVNHAAVTGFSNEFSEVAMINQDGYEQGTLSDFSVGQDGIVTGIFSNGQTRNIAQIALARFANNNGLISVGDNIFRVAANSGLPIIGTPGTFARGTIRGGFLEESNVDMAKQFTDLIVSQRAFQANARTISVANEMLQDLVNII
jgi:flagellar hook-basal body protein